MPINVRCPSCGSKLGLPDNCRGKPFTCWVCSTPFTVPAAAKASASGQKTSLPPGDRTGEVFMAHPPPEVDPPRGLPPEVDDEDAEDRDEEAPVVRRRRSERTEEERQPSTALLALGIASLALGVIGFLLAWMPFLGLAGLVLGGLGLVCGLAGVLACWLRREGGIGFSAAGTMVSLLATAVAGVWLVLRSAPPPQPAPIVPQAAAPAPAPAAPEVTTAPPGEEEWTDASKGLARVGDVQVQLGVLDVGEVRVDDVLDGQKMVKEGYLRVPILIQNVGATKKIDYRGWGTALSGATLTDNFDNKYKRVDFGFGAFPIGQVKETTSIYPGKQVEDLLIFEPPVQGVQYLRLALPASAVGATGAFRLQLPIGRAARTKRPG